MRRIFLAITALAFGVFLLAANALSRSQPAKQEAPRGGQSSERSDDESAIRANIAAFVKAYNAGDGQAVSALFTPDGQIESKDGQINEGRAAIAQTFQQLFAEAPKKRIEVAVESIRFVGKELAVETGTTKETVPGEEPEYDRYTVLHVKRDGKWAMALARDEEGPAETAHEHLQPLEWLVGEWVDDGGSSVIRTSCRWSADGNFLLQEFDLRLDGRDAMKVSQRIGWDPVAKQIHSWVFDSEGGFGESLWTRDDDRWIIKATGIRPDGTTGSATNTLTRIGADTYVWTTSDRIVAGEVQAPMEVRVARKPPEPRR